MAYPYDNGEENEMYRCERDEARSAREQLKESDRTDWDDFAEGSTRRRRR